MQPIMGRRPPEGAEEFDPVHLHMLSSEMGAGGDPYRWGWVLRILKLGARPAMTVALIVAVAEGVGFSLLP
jgi:hypothetical protein